MQHIQFGLKIAKMSQFYKLLIIFVFSNIVIVSSQKNSLDTGILLAPVYYDSNSFKTKLFGNFLQVNQQKSFDYIIF